MTLDTNAAAMQRYHARFDSAHYNAAADLFASNLYADRDDDRVVQGMVMLQNAAFGLCGHTDFVRVWHPLAVFCGQNFLSFHTVDAMRDFLRLFASDDTRIDDFESTAKAMLRAYSGLDDLKTATAHANGVHGWRGRMAYDLLAAVDYLTQAAIQLLVEGDETYTREKLHKGLNRITGALYEGIRHSDQPQLYNFKSVYFPDERDHR
jgi:hypothetical protein